MTRGIDVSKYQKSADWDKVRDSGVSFAIIRATLGSYTFDPMFECHYAGAKAAGLGVGAYHYFYATNAEEAKAEADFFLQTIGGKDFDYPVAVDVEEMEIAHAGKEALTAAVVAFCEAVENAGYYICVYANPAWLNTYLDAEKLKPYDLWLAHWDVPGPSRECGIWQYTSSGNVMGIAGRVDMNVAYKEYPSLIKEANLNGFGHAEEEAVTVPVESAPAYAYKIGDHVVFSTCYISSTAPIDQHIEAKSMARNHGVITKIVDAANPYLLDDGLCWVNDGDIRGYYTE